jgi:hypothetical protein
MAIVDAGPLTFDRKSDLHPFPRFWEGGPEGELLFWKGKVKASHPFEVEEDLASVEVGILIAEEGEVPLVGFGSDGDFPLVVVVIV